MFCPNCAAPLREGTKICLQCGTSVALSTAETSTPSSMDKGDRLPPNRLSALCHHSLLPVLSFVCFALFCCVIFGVSSFTYHHWLRWFFFPVSVICGKLLRLCSRSKSSLKKTREDLTSLCYMLLMMAAFVIIAILVLGKGRVMRFVISYGLIIPAALQVATCLLTAWELRKLRYNLWLTSEPSYSLQHVKVGSLISVIIAFATAVFVFRFSVSPILLSLGNTLTGILLLLFRKESRRLRAQGIRTTETKEE